MLLPFRRDKGPFVYTVLSPHITILQYHKSLVFEIILKLCHPGTAEAWMLSRRSVLCCPVKGGALPWADPSSQGALPKCVVGFKVSEICCESEQARSPNS